MFYKAFYILALWLIYIFSVYVLDKRIGQTNLPCLLMPFIFSARRDRRINFDRVITVHRLVFFTADRIDIF